nr:proline-rich receptor-like protein kinase PERK9 [Lolium perenne]
MDGRHVCPDPATSSTPPPSSGNPKHVKRMHMNRPRLGDAPAVHARAPPGRRTATPRRPVLSSNAWQAARPVASLLSVAQRDARVLPNRSTASQTCPSTAPLGQPSAAALPPSVHGPGARCTGRRPIKTTPHPPFLHFPRHSIPRPPPPHLLGRRGALLLPVVELAVFPWCAVKVADADAAVSSPLPAPWKLSVLPVLTRPSFSPRNAGSRRPDEQQVPPSPPYVGGSCCFRRRHHPSVARDPPHPTRPTSPTTAPRGEHAVLRHFSVRR